MADRRRITGDELRRRVERLAAAAVTKATDHIGAESQRIVLLRDGDLARSGGLVPAEPGPNPVATYRYTIVYARRRHEETHRRDGTPIRVSTPGRMPKFLEIPFKAESPRIAAFVARVIERGLELGSREALG